jgi:serine/threonine protein kinase
LIGDNGQTYGIRADMWALGLSLFEIVAGKQPFANMSSFQTMMTIRTWTPSLPSNPRISNDMKQLIISLYVYFVYVRAGKNTRGVWDSYTYSTINRSKG